MVRLNEVELVCGGDMGFDVLWSGEVVRAVNERVVLCVLWESKSVIVACFSLCRVVFGVGTLEDGDEVLSRWGTGLGEEEVASRGTVGIDPWLSRGRR